MMDARPHPYVIWIRSIEFFRAEALDNQRTGALAI
jgi:hypothetical protein